MKIYHTPVMVKECIKYLQIDRKKIFVDLTFGGGGHSKEILKHLSKDGFLIAFDCDKDAEFNTKFINDDRFLFIRSNFCFLKKYLKIYKYLKVDGILVDLGISSHQLKKAERGFSFKYDAPLDMRMNCNQRLTARDILQNYNEKKLFLLFKNGQVQNARNIAKNLIRARNEGKIIYTTYDLVNILKPFTPKMRNNKYLAKIFQALRIVVNNELTVLPNMLLQVKEVLKKNGRLAVLSYHSLEDRLVKNFMKTGQFDGSVEKDFYGNILRPFRPVIKKPLIPSVEEIIINKKARSAKLRVAEKI